MNFLARRLKILVFVFTLITTTAPVSGHAQQIVQRGTLGRPASVLDETEQWTDPIFLTSDHDIEMYIPDVSHPEWLARNYRDYMDKNQFVLSMFTFYRRPQACRANQIAWGFSDGAHLDQCNIIGYRVRRATVDKRQKTVTLIMAAMIGQDGVIDSSSVQDQPITRNWADLDTNSQKALNKAVALISEQMKIYDLRINGNL